MASGPGDMGSGRGNFWRPGNLPRKTEEESLRHYVLVQDLAQSIQKKAERGRREEESRRAREEQRERRMHEHAEIWFTQLLSDYVPGTKPSSRMEQLWRQGLPPRVREVLWPMAIGNVLRITPELYEIHKDKAVECRADHAGNVLVTLSKGRSHGREMSTQTIPFDLPRTFPSLAFFCEGGPLHDDCARILEAYTFFRPDIGYVQGMSYLAAVLLLYLPAYQAFVGLCNLINSPSVLGLYRLEPEAVECRARLFNKLCSLEMPQVARRLDIVGLTPEMFLIEWFMTLYSKPLHIDIASVVWDLFLLDGEVVLYCTAIALLRLSEDELLSDRGSELEGVAQILGDDLRSRANDSSELLQRIQEVRGRAPRTLLDEIKQIENAEFMSAAMPRSQSFSVGGIRATSAQSIRGPELVPSLRSRFQRLLHWY